MVIEGFRLEETETACPYLADRIFKSENLIIEKIDSEGLNQLLLNGYRHFGRYFFRPVCAGCSECRSIRVPLNEKRLSKSDKRVLSRGSSLDCQVIENPSADKNMYNLYLKHKERFGADKENENYEAWSDSFFSDNAFSRILKLTSDGNTVSVLHLDIFSEGYSAVYCYWDPVYSSFSPGRLSILKAEESALREGKRYIYLGYYIEECSHMAYKADYRPNELLLPEGLWKRFKD